MRNQLIPEISLEEDISFFDSLIRPKNKRFKEALIAIREDVINSYKSYSDNVKSLSSILPLGYNNDNKDALISCYTQPTEILSKIKSSIKVVLTQVDYNYCPYCSIGYTKQFDHYLAKSVFSEFSVFTKNLIFVCKDCNEEKSETRYGLKRTIHSYFEDIPNQQFLFCDIDDVGMKIDFRIEHIDGISDETFQILKNHFEALNLRERYIVESVPILSEYKREWKLKLAREDSVKKVIDQIEIDLLDRIEVQINQLGNNYFKAIFHQKVLDKLPTILSSI